MTNTLAQQRSAFALKEIEILKVDRDSFAKLVAGLPAMILQNGFGQTLAFLLAKKEDRHIQAFEIMMKWLKERNIITGSDRAGAIKELSTMAQDKYLHAQEEGLAVLEWVQRYAKAGLFTSK